MNRNQTITLVGAVATIGIFVLVLVVVSAITGDGDSDTRPGESSSRLSPTTTLEFVFPSFGGNITTPPVNPDCLRAASFNIHGGVSPADQTPNLEDVAALAALYGTDILLLQEVTFADMEWLAAQLGMAWAFYQLDDTGVAVLSRVPVTAADGIPLPGQTPAGVLHAQLDPEDAVNDPASEELENLHVYNVYLSENTGEPDHHTMQVEALLDWIAEQHGPAWTERLLLGGTFYFAPDNPLYDAITDNAVFRDPLAGLRIEDSWTYFTPDGYAARYDHLFTANLPLSGSGVDLDPAAGDISDHRMVVVSFARRDGIVCAP